MIGCLLAEGWWWRGREVRKTWEQCVRDDSLGLLSGQLIWGKRLSALSVEKWTF